MGYCFYVTPEQYVEAETHGITRGTLDRRIRNLAWPIEKAITTKPQKRNSINELIKVAQQNGICESTLRTRLDRGWDKAKAATAQALPIKQNCKRTGEMNRKHPEECQVKALGNGISHWMFNYRLRHDWTLEDACTIPTCKINKGAKAWK